MQHKKATQNMTKQEEKTVKTAVIYIRHADGKSCPSIEKQKIACFKYAAEHGYAITAVYTNILDGDVRLGSIAYQKLSECAKKNKSNRILFYSIKSVFNFEQDFLISSTMLKKNGIDLISVTEPDYVHPGMQMVASILRCYDEYLRAEHSQRVKQGMRLAKERKAALAAAEKQADT